MPGSFRFTTALQKSVHQTLKLINIRASGLICVRRALRSFTASPCGDSVSRMASVSSDGSQRGHTARTRSFQIEAKPVGTGSARRRRLKKRPAYTVNQRCTRPSSSARPLGIKRLQRLSRKSRSHYSKRDRRSSLILRAAPATRSSSTLEPEPSRRPRAAPATSTPRARETSAPRA